MHIIFASVLSVIINLGIISANKNFSSQTFIWDQYTPNKTENGETREFLTNCSTNYLEHFQIKAITINPEKSFSRKNFSSKAEQLLIIKEGRMTLTLNKKNFSIGPGSIILSGCNDNIEIFNSDTNPLTFFLFQWKTKNGKTPVSNFSAKVIDWQNVQFKPTEKGGVRTFLKIPTDLLTEFEMHVTTLDEGIKSHDPHTHPDDEIILVKTGMVEEVVNGTAYQMGGGSFILLNGNEPHGIRNIGDKPCEYFAFRFK